MDESYFPPIVVARDHKLPLYRQLCDWFREAILSGVLKPGQRVPSTRSLAADLNISRAPVLIAFEQLHAEGYLQSSPGGATRVAAELPGSAARHVKRNALGSTRRSGSEAAGEMLPSQVTSVWNSSDQWWRLMGAFRIGRPDLDRFPSGTWSSLVGRHVRSSTKMGVGDIDLRGYPPLRESIAEYLRIARGVRCQPEQIMIVNGAQQALHIAARALLKWGDAAWIEEPGYWGARAALESAGAQLVPVEVDVEGLRVEEGEALKHDARLAYVTPSHQFPLGYIMSLRRRLLLLDWAARNHAWILEDDYDSEYRFAGEPLASLQSLDVDDRVIFIGTFSKVLCPELRLGYMVVPHTLIPAFQALRQTIDLTPMLYQMALADFISEGHFARHIRRMKKLYMERRKTFMAAMSAHTGERFHIIDTVAGLQAAAMLPPDMQDVILSRKLAESGISAFPISRCCLKKPSKNGLLLGYASADSEHLWSGAESLGRILRERT